MGGESSAMNLGESYAASTATNERQSPLAAIKVRIIALHKSERKEVLH